MFGWYPGPNSTGQLSNNIEHILKPGRTLFVNLTSISELASLYNYIPVVLQNVTNPIFIHHPIDDQGLPSDIDSYIKLINLLQRAPNEACLRARLF